MALTHKSPIFTKRDYLDFERHQDNRHVFLDGSVFAMAGKSLKHSKFVLTYMETYTNNYEENRAMVFHQI